jgi:hypothetical protein
MAKAKWSSKEVRKSTVKTVKQAEQKPFVFLKDIDILVGIDPGTSTGFAVKEKGVLVSVETLTIVEAILRVHALEARALALGLRMLVRLEDAHLRDNFGGSGPEKWQGAGSIKRDCTIWKTELQRRGIEFQVIHPKNVRETTAKQFEQLCGWKKRSSEHAREAAWMII